MSKKPFLHHEFRRYSARAAITLWLALAIIIWGTLGMILGYAAHRGDARIDAEGERLSTIAPAAGTPMPASPADPSAQEKAGLAR